jgi:hypothetical protein
MQYRSLGLGLGRELLTRLGGQLLVLLQHFGALGRC